MFAEALRERTRGIAELSGAQVALLEAHYQLMVYWNQKLNLTKITALDEAIDRHYLEALFLDPFTGGKPARCRYWLGTGFPGLPVAVLRPDCEVTLIESHQRKAVFLREASRNLKNVRVLAKRGEGLEERFDWGISRAVSYEDLQEPLGVLAPQFLLLTGADEPPSDWQSDWLDAIPVPNGIARYLRRGAWKVLQAG